jgi:hypothetical protein
MVHYEGLVGVGGISLEWGWLIMASAYASKLQEEALQLDDVT